MEVLRFAVGQALSIHIILGTLAFFEGASSYGLLSRRPEILALNVASNKPRHPIKDDGALLDANPSRCKQLTVHAATNLYMGEGE